MNLWSDDDLILVLEFFFKCPEHLHTDGHPCCQSFAGLLQRSPGALDKLLRNIKSVVTNSAGLPHASAKVRSLVARFGTNLPQLYASAIGIRAARGWPPLDCCGEISAPS